ncbi:DEAD/DEAH box helicase [Salininema proteolyticum]|uniref:DEAD/DEAH box helicase n=2 Tax=Salininema proteolyticum TaxID=1607685 RepID=A0ABV8TYR6_9ACTN
MTIENTLDDAARTPESGSEQHIDTPESADDAPAPQPEAAAEEAQPETVEVPEQAPAEEEAPVAEAPAEEAPKQEDAPAEEAPEKPEKKALGFDDLGLPDTIVAALASKGITEPFPIQTATIPDALNGRDVLGRGRTGSGKTMAFGLPALTRLAEDGVRTAPGRPRAVLLTPTRELAMQVAESLEPYGDAIGISMKVVCGGTAFSRQIEALRRGVDVLVATPGRLRDLISRGEASLADVDIAVLDEADQMADMGFLPEVEELFDQLPDDGQRMLFSATLEQEIGVLVRKYLTEPVEHSVDPSAGAVTTMTHHLLLIGPRDKRDMTAAIAGRPGNTMVFVRTQLAVDRIAEELVESGVNAAGLHGGMSQADRSRTLDRFKDGKLDALVATDVAARGIHVDGVDFVLHVDPPKNHKDYLHRAGRTARAGESGTVATLVLPHQNRQMFQLIERAGVEAQRHYVRDNFEAPTVELLGARNFTELRAAKAERQITVNDREVKRLERQIERLKEDNEGLRVKGAELRERAEREIIEGPSERRGGGKGRGKRDHGDRGGRRDYSDRGGDRRGGGRGDKRGGYGRGRDRDFGDRRGGRDFGGDRRGGRDFGGDRRRGRDFDDRGGKFGGRKNDRGFDRGDDRRGGGFDRGDDRRGGGGFDRRDDRGDDRRGGGRFSGKSDRGNWREFDDRGDDRRGGKRHGGGGKRRW